MSGSRRWAGSALWSAAALGTVAMFVVPARLAAGRGYAAEEALVAAASAAFTRSGDGGDQAALRDLIAFWREFHLVKAGLALVVVIALGVLGWSLGRAASDSGPGWRRRGALTAYAMVVTWALGALTLLLANVQGAIAPLSSVASLLPTGRRSGELGEVLDDLRRGVRSDRPGAGLAGDLLHDFTIYHAAFAVMAAIVGVTLTTLALRAISAAWRQRRQRRPAPPTWGWQVGLFGIAGALFVLLAAANASTWVRPVPALVASLGG